MFIPLIIKKYHAAPPSLMYVQSNPIQSLAVPPYGAGSSAAIENGFSLWKL